MLNRRGIWWQIWMVPAVVWTLVASASAWIDLPRAQHMPHDPGFNSKLSTEAASILSGPAVDATPVRGALVWTGSPKTVRMLNGTRLSFPAFTPDKLAAIVENEYRQLLSIQADEQRGQFLLARLAIWFAPLLITGLAMGLLSRRQKPAPVRGNADKMVRGLVARETIRPVPASYRQSSAANGDEFSSMFANEQLRPH